MLVNTLYTLFIRYLINVIMNSEISGKYRSFFGWHTVFLGIIKVIIIIK